MRPVWHKSRYKASPILQLPVYKYTQIFLTCSLRTRLPYLHASYEPYKTGWYNVRFKFFCDHPTHPPGDPRAITLKGPARGYEIYTGCTKFNLKYMQKRPARSPGHHTPRGPWPLGVPRPGGGWVVAEQFEPHIKRESHSPHTRLVIARVLW